MVSNYTIGTKVELVVVSSYATRVIKTATIVKVNATTAWTDSGDRFSLKTGRNVGSTLKLPFWRIVKIAV